MGKTRIALSLPLYCLLATIGSANQVQSISPRVIEFKSELNQPLLANRAPLLIAPFEMEHTLPPPQSAPNRNYLTSRQLTQLALLFVLLWVALGVYLLSVLVYLPVEAPFWQSVRDTNREEMARSAMIWVQIGKRKHRSRRCSLWLFGLSWPVHNHFFSRIALASSP